VLVENAKRLFFGILSEERSAERGIANGNKIRRSSPPSERQRARAGIQ
jgi:hypothetical protein